VTVHRLGFALVALLVLGGAARAEKDDDDDKGSVEARKLFTVGNEKYAKGDYDGAIAAFKAAIAADAKLPGPYRNLGLVYRAQGKCEEALPMYEKYLELKPESRFTDRVRREIDICRQKLNMTPLPNQPRHPSGSYHAPESQSYLHVAANMIGGEVTDEASVRVDGIIRGSTPLTIPITAGKHRVHLERPGFEPADAAVDVAPGQRAEVELTMNKLAVEQQPIVTGDGGDQVDDRPKGSYRKYAWSLLAVGAGLGIVGAGFGIAESALYRDAINLDKSMTTRADADRNRNTGANYAIASYVGLSVGAAALIASVVMFVVDPSRKVVNDSGKYAVTPFVGKEGGGVAAAVRF
jgi:tetratricopeptide (TPR) repeat protein